MASQFTHRQDGIFSFSSICDKCFRLVATRERESELRQDEAIHSCKISLPGTKPTPAYWGILCRTCTELVAFHTRPPLDSEPGAEGSMAGTIRCTKDHSHIYFRATLASFHLRLSSPARPCRRTSKPTRRSIPSGNLPQALGPPNLKQSTKTRYLVQPSLRRQRERSPIGPQSGDGHVGD
jgi:hypothetical protein